MGIWLVERREKVGLKWGWEIVLERFGLDGGWNVVLVVFLGDVLAE